MNVLLGLLSGLILGLALAFLREAMDQKYKIYRRFGAFDRIACVGNDTACYEVMP